MSKEPESTTSKLPERTGASGPPDGFGKGVNEYLNNYIRNADAKAGILVAADLTIGAYLLANQPSDFWACALSWLAIALFAISAVLGRFVVYPRTPSSGIDLIFWEDILSRDDVATYQRDLRSLDSRKVEEEYAAQNFYVSEVLHQRRLDLELRERP